MKSISRHLNKNHARRRVRSENTSVQIEGSGCQLDFDAKERPKSFQVKLTPDLLLCGYREGANSYQLVLTNVKTDQEAELNLGVFVPKHRFASDRQFAVDPLKNEIKFDYQELQYNPKSIVFLFHELGHAKILEDAGTLKFPYAIAIARAKQRQHSSVKHSKKLIKEERNAWAVGLRIARKCRDMGFNIFEMFDDTTAITALMREDSLETYEVVLGRLVGEEELRKFSRKREH